MNKTTLAALLGVIVWVSPVFADVSIQFNTLGTTVTNFAGNPAPVNTWMTQLIWSDNSTANAFDDSTPLNPGTGEIVLLTLYPDSTAGKIASSDYVNATTLPQPNSFVSGTTQTYSNSAYGGAILQNGYAYYRVFDSTNPVAGDHYYQGAITAGTLPALPSFTVITIPSIQTTTTIVPEPTSLGLLGLGLALVGLRKMRRSA